MKLELQELFKKQHPDQQYSLKKFRILNWPFGSQFIQGLLDQKEMKIIKGKMNIFEFVPIQLIMKPKWKTSLVLFWKELDQNLGVFVHFG